MTTVDLPENEAWYELFRGRVTWERAEEFLDAQLADIVRNDPVLWAEFKDLMNRAVRVGLPYDKDETGRGFKWPMERAAENIGELKMDVGNNQHRIYFGAPSELPAVLLALLYGMKLRDAPDWYVTQNAHIDEADRRYRRWRGDYAAQAVTK